MDERSFQKLLRRTVALPVFLLVVLAGILAVEIGVLSASLRWVDHSDQVISRMRQATRNVLEMETALRGYYLTGDRSFLDAYNEAKSQASEQLDAVAALTADNAAQQQRLRRVRDAELQWQQSTEQELAGDRHGPPSDAVLRQGQQKMLEVRNQQRAFIAVEEGLRAQRTKRSETINATVVGSAVALLLLTAVFLFTFTRRELIALSTSYEQHLRAEIEQQQQLKQSREWFQITLKSLAEAVVATDEGGRISFINPVAQQLTGWEYHAAHGRPFSEVVRLSEERTRLRH